MSHSCWSNRPHPQPAADPIACPVADFITGRSRWSDRQCSYRTMADDDTSAEAAHSAEEARLRAAALDEYEAAHEAL
jgi:hypothetical protein